jgi:hypothetical protein
MCFVQGVNIKDSAIAVAERLSLWHVMQKISNWIWHLKNATNRLEKILNWNSFMQFMGHSNLSGFCS